MKTYGGLDVQTHVFLISALLGGEWSASHHGRFTSVERAPVRIVQEPLWVSEPVRTTWRSKMLAPTGTRIPTTLSSSP
jgi:hypothetical protein